MMSDLVILSGPTAVGKSSLAVRLAQKIGGSIISADSMQVYKGMDIGTAKITKEEMGDIPHYLIDVLDPADDFNIVTFKNMAVSAIHDIYEKGRIPIIVGGTGFYIQSVLYDIDFTENKEMPDYRDELMRLIEDKGPGFVHDMLKEADPDAALHIHPNDSKRMIRALEYNRQTGKMLSEHNRKCMQNISPYNFCYFVLTDKRELIYDRINARVDKMIKDGLVDEVRFLVEAGLTKENVSMHALGYKEIIDFLEGNTTLDEAVSIIKRDSRHFAKRQLTWFRREKEVYWLDLQNGTDVLDEIMIELKRKGIING